MKNRSLSKAIPLLLITVFVLSGCGITAGKTSGMVGRTEDEIKKGTYENGISCHDPQIIFADDKSYYMTGSHQVIAKSTDLDRWDYVANGNHMFSNIFSGDLPAFSYVGKNEEGGYSIWASDIFYNEVMEKYVMYFCTTSSYIKSNLCMAVSDTPEGPYEYTDTILYSGFSKSQAEETNVYDVLGKNADISAYLKYGGYDNTRWPNCIDPSLFTDEDGRQWMVYGSWSGGIFLLEIDPKTGLPIHTDEDGSDPYYGYHLIGGGHHAVEGPYIVYSPESGYYHLFVSYGNLQAKGGYQIRQYRSKNVTGPYVDAKGLTLGDEEDYMNYGVKMMGNYTLPSLNDTYMAPGGQSVFRDKNGDYCLVYHQRFSDRGEYHEPRIHKMLLNPDGWFCIMPFEITEEKEETYEYSDDVSGVYYILDHGTDVSDLVPEYKECVFKNNAFKTDEASGTYSVTPNTNEITLKAGSDSYSGVIADMTDEAGNAVRVISAVGDNNRSIWAVSYR